MQQLENVTRERTDADEAMHTFLLLSILPRQYYRIFLFVLK